MRRHRKPEVQVPNISLLQYNWRGIRDRHIEKAKVFNRPGFEENTRLVSHNLNDLLNADALLRRVDAIPRIQKQKELQPKKQLADLEHYVIQNLLASYGVSGNGPAQLQGYLREAWFLTAYPQQLVPFRQGPPSLKVFLTFDEENQECIFCEKNEKGYPVPRELHLGIARIKIHEKASKRLWLTRNFEVELEALAEQQALSLRSVSLRYGELNFRYDERAKYEYNDQFGLVKI